MRISGKKEIIIHLMEFIIFNLRGIKQKVQNTRDFQK
jgi:hypothetical protein